ncbi:MAG TPA: hypothetical protein VMY76_03955 [Gemmatimonadales bacterium]|nr:hypothetical protein [Gemmatimonadales bacterium]
MTGRPIPPREVRLKPEFAELYAEIPPDRWLLASEVAALVVLRASTARRLSIHVRTLDPAHFEFRGGAPREPAARARTRVTDGIRQRPHR